REPNVSDSPTLKQLHAAKTGTPLMGGLFLVGSLAVTLLAVGPIADPRLWLALLSLAAFGSIGLADDWLKTRGSGRGLSARVKLAGQIAVSSAVGLLLVRCHVVDAANLALGWLCVPWAALVLVASANAVNLADGLDGLAGGLVVVASAAWAWIAYRSGAGSCLVMAAATCGATLGFLWFNRHPARVFMGDTGSLALGGMLGLMALLLGQELRLLAIGGVLVAEAASVLLQVSYFKWRRKRIFRCAPLHHHFQFLGWPETRIVARFWLAGVVCALAGVLV
ncbi:MAG TPA: phospho-N-acetylmuramoyl-pentapeptide-transferase, partial [Pirellulales bacterium]|nr:phospho-N-acetylmuramoyl-pentapeptide-transferase [Pirellulales bacterium]